MTPEEQLHDLVAYTAKHLGIEGSISFDTALQYKRRWLKHRKSAKNFIAEMVRVFGVGSQTLREEYWYDTPKTNQDR